MHTVLIFVGYYRVPLIFVGQSPIIACGILYKCVMNLE